MLGERVFVGLGSNLADPVCQVTSATSALARMNGTKLVRVSSLYRNPPLGPIDQPDFVNAVAEIETELEPLELLDRLLCIEHAHGRTRDDRRWQARTLDLDLLVYGDRRMHHERLTLPHPGVAVRSFVLHPLAEIAPEAVVPGVGVVGDLARAVSACGLTRVPAKPAFSAY